MNLDRIFDFITAASIDADGKIWISFARNCDVALEHHQFVLRERREGLWFWL